MSWLDNPSFWAVLKDVLPIAIGAIGTIGSALIGYLKWKKEHEEVARLSRENGALTQELRNCTLNHTASAEEFHLEKQSLLTKISEADWHMAEICRTHAVEVDRLKEVISSLQSEIEKLISDITQREREIRHQDALSKKMVDIEGKFWEVKTESRRPQFVPRNERGGRQPVIFSMLNLKGGVGKTTLTANIGAALAAQGQRVLFIDVDLQGSLTSLLMPFDKLKSLSSDNLLLQDFLTTTCKPGPVNLLEYAQQAFEGSASCLVPTSDRLAYVDMTLMATWMLRLGNYDSRFLLRRGLHQKRIFDKFDVILIDCPPLLNTCCINALNASDYVLIPVTPSEHSVDRVPHLVHMLKHSINQLNPHLSIGGLIYNMTYRSELTQNDQVTWNSVLRRAADQLGSPVRGFNTFVRNMTEVRRTEDDFVIPEIGTERYEVFRALAEEILEIVPSAASKVG